MPIDYCRQNGKFKNKGTYTLSNSEMISKIERHSLDALPALQTENYDGWKLRFANGHMRRANSVNFLEPGDLPLAQKVMHCEEAYRRIGQPCHFRLTPLADPSLETFLEERGYGLHDPTEVRLLTSIKARTFSPTGKVLISDQPTEAWLKSLAQLTDQSPAKQDTFLRMIELTSLKARFASVLHDGRVVSCGLGIGSEHLLGLYEFATDLNFRRQGLARDIVQALLKDAKRRGIDTAYLQVVISNTAGVRFWREMGFDQSLYSYHYRSKSGA
ncbi:MAG: GNAT family N-acetyltransferase [Proteobacteria bacterium]|nr:GNAT family N-acetyltransferase [Pseudomonadota bacterium]